MATCSALQLHCVVIELELVDEERILKYLYEHVYSYNWILREDKEAKKARICVWWREEEYKRFCTTPLRSFLKRLKIKAGYDKIPISREMTTEEGVQTMCNGALHCISKYYLEDPLYPYLREVLSFDPPENAEFTRDRTTQNEKRDLILRIVGTLDISTKLDVLQRITAATVPAVKHMLHINKWVSEVNENPPSPLITHAGESSQPEMEQNFPFEDPFFPPFPPSSYSVSESQ